MVLNRRDKKVWEEERTRRNEEKVILALSISSDPVEGKIKKGNHEKGHGLYIWYTFARFISPHFRTASSRDILYRHTRITGFNIDLVFSKVQERYNKSMYLICTIWIILANIYSRRMTDLNTVINIVVICSRDDDWNMIRIPWDFDRLR